MAEGLELPEGLLQPAVVTPEGEKSLEDRVFDAVTAKLEAAMDEAIKVAREETSERFQDVARLAMEGAAAAHNDALLKINAQADLAIKTLTDQAERRMAHATEQVKLAVKDGSDLGKRINDLKDRLFEIAAEAETEAKDRVEKAVATVAETAEKYRRHIELASETMTKAGNQILQFQEELKPIKKFMEDCANNGISPQSLHALVVQVGKLGNGGNGHQNGRPHWEKRGGYRRERRG